MIMHHAKLSCTLPFRQYLIYNFVKEDPSTYLCLSQLIVMMRELEVHAASMNIHGHSMYAGGHDGALDMPARPARTPGGVPGGLSRLGRLPQSKIIWAALLGEAVL